MKNIKHYLLGLLALAFVVVSCDEDEELINQRLAENPLPGEVTGSAGTFNFSRYISIGNSLAAGFQDNALYTDAQDQSFPALFAQQLATTGVGGGAFNQPDINSANGFAGNGPSGPLGRFELSLSLLRPVPTAGELPTPYTGDKSALSNFAVPGMTQLQVNDPGLAANGLYARFASNPGTSTVLGDALATNPSFYTYWLGNNDVLRYAVSGGADISLISDTGDFQASITESLGALANSGARGVVINLPPVVVAPFFRAVPWNAVPLDEATATLLNGGFAGFNQALLGLLQASGLGVPGISTTQADVDQRTVTYAAGQNPILMVDTDLVDYNRPGGEFDILQGIGAIDAAQRAALAPFGQARPATPNDLPLLTAATEIGREIAGPTVLSGISLPIADNFILSATEVVRVVTARATFNAVIDGVVAGVNQVAGGQAITILDTHPIFADVFGLDAASATALALTPAGIAAADGTLGIVVDGVTLAPDFSPNGIVSTDGIHPNPRGHAIIANALIDHLNGLGADIPSVNVLALRSVLTTD